MSGELLSCSLPFLLSQCFSQARADPHKRKQYSDTSEFSSLVPLVQRRVQKDVLQRCQHVRVGRCRRQTGN